jgi:hypothetical protein
MSYCTNCGTGLPEGARFCAGCGTPVTVQQPPPPPPAVPPPQYAAPPPAQYATPPQQPPAYQAAPKAPRSRRPLILVTGVIAVVAIVVVAVSLFKAASGETGGASSPEEAVGHLAGAVDSGDPVAIANTFAPDEREGLSGVAKAGKSAAGTVGVRSPKIDVSIKQRHAAKLADGVVAVDVDATMDVDPRAFGGLFNAVLAGRPGRVTTDQNDSFRVIAIREHGRWFVSPLLTLGDYLTRTNGLPEGDYSRASESDGGGAATKQEAVKRLLDAIAAKDPNAAESVVGPAEARVMRVYAVAIKHLLDGAGYSARFSNVSLEEKNGKVEFAGAHLDADSTAGSASVDLTRRCGATGDAQACILQPSELRDKLGVDGIAFTVEGGAGSYRVHLLATLNDLLSRVGRLSRTDVRAALGWEDPSTLAYGAGASPLKVGSTENLSFAGQPYAVREVKLGAGDGVSVSYIGSDTPPRADGDAEAGVELFTQDDHGRWDDESYNYFFAKKPTVVRVVVGAPASSQCTGRYYGLYSGCWFRSGGHFHLKAVPLRTQRATIPGRLSATLGEFGVARFVIHVDEPSAYTIEPSTGTSADIEPLSEGYSSYPCAGCGGPQHFDPGDYELTLTEENNGGGEVGVDIRPSDEDPGP